MGIDYFLGCAAQAMVDKVVGHSQSVATEMPTTSTLIATG